MEPRIWSLEWNDAMSVGIREIDEDHKRFIDLVDAFNNAVAAPMVFAEVQRRLQDIIDDALRHFAHESRLLAEWRYPGAEHHARMHAQLAAEMQRVKSALSSRSHEAEWVEAGLKVKDILITHIHMEDMKYAEFYRDTRAATGAGGK